MIDAKLNRYYTPGHVSNSFIKVIQRDHAVYDWTFMEPFVGEGGMIPEGFNDQFVTNDIDHDVVADFHSDVMSDDFEAWFARQDVNMILTNPPFQTYETVEGKNKRKYHATDFIERLMTLAEEHNKNIKLMSFLVRLSILEPTVKTRALLDKAHEIGYDLWRVDVTNRISFTGDGSTDSVTTCFLTFNSNWESCHRTPTFHFLPKE